MSSLLAFRYSNDARDLNGMDERCMGSSTGPLHLAHLCRRLYQTPLMKNRRRLFLVALLGQRRLRTLKGEGSCISVILSFFGWLVPFLKNGHGIILVVL